MNKLIGKKVVITSDNENYDEFRDKELTIIDAYNKGTYYDKSVYPMLLCEFEDKDGNDILFALYEWEFQII